MGSVGGRGLTGNWKLTPRNLDFNRFVFRALDQSAWWSADTGQHARGGNHWWRKRARPVFVRSSDSTGGSGASRRLPVDYIYIYIYMYIYIYIYILTVAILAQVFHTLVLSP